MIRLFALIFLLVPQISWGQSTLPPCTAAESDLNAFRNNCFASVTFPNGSKYVGEFQDNKPNGQGTVTFPSGNKYVGEFRDGKFNGQGTVIFANGDKYVGEYRDGKRNGQGTYTFASGNKYVGEYRDGKFNGQGTFIFANGDRYAGEFRDGKFNGQGIEYRSDGSIAKSGQWADGALIQSYALDTNRFPFNTNVADDGKAERARLAAEVEAERKKRNELEERLAAESKERDRLAQEARERERLLAEANEREKQLAEAKERERQQAQAPQPQRPQAVLRNERRLALIIGNSSYKVSPLDNPANDATDIAESLKKFGFQTTLVRNATLGQMREATRKFADQLPSADVALIYFAGHGIEANRKNYMIPVNADLKFEYELADQGYDAGIWLEMLESIKSNNADRVNIVILDACRNNSLIGSRNLGRGLGKMDAPSGTFLAYSTAPGKVAADGGRGERNSPFTKHLLRAMQQPNQPIEEVFKEVRRNVGKETNGAQVPWESTSLTGFVAFRQARER